MDSMPAAVIGHMLPTTHHPHTMVFIHHWHALITWFSSNSISFSLLHLQHSTRDNSMTTRSHCFTFTHQSVTPLYSSTNTCLNMIYLLYASYSCFISCLLTHSTMHTWLNSSSPLLILPLTLLSEISIPSAKFSLMFILKIMESSYSHCFIDLSHDPEELRSSSSGH